MADDQQADCGCDHCKAAALHEGRDLTEEQKVERRAFIATVENAIAIVAYDQEDLAWVAAELRKMAEHNDPQKPSRMNPWPTAGR